MTQRISLVRRKAGRFALAAGLLAALGATAHAAEPLHTCFLYSNPIGESGWTWDPLESTCRHASLSIL